ncbi:hypothetical protein Ahy_A08g040863 isoform A [Arachis hypogaea]|uniref:Uncharacterized protein n=1 Tax=Arachis hypogaea TaxID=3818 RepID=A0A445C0U2_ARAHY|nr:hypothetical protein Ahy_A08g040863 isoform A [Arachis hypogaea]
MIAVLVKPHVRCCYFNTLDLTQEELVKVILVYSGFIVELFWRHHYVRELGIMGCPKSHIGCDFPLSCCYFQCFNSFGFPYNGDNDIIIRVNYFTDLLRAFWLKPIGAIIEEMW